MAAADPTALITTPRYLPVRDLCTQKQKWHSLNNRMSLESRHFFTELKRHATETSSGSTVVSYMSDLGPSFPVLTLIHGYPQSAFIWRYIVPKLLNKVSLFVPELPGYGISTPATVNSREAIGGALMEALTSVFNISQTNTRAVILGGHDRGARLCHRLAVSHSEPTGLQFIASILIDIVPTAVQWDKFSDPAIACNYFHWPLLANVSVAVEFLKAFGGGEYVRQVSLRLAPTEAGKERVQADGAVDVYAALFEKEETLRYSCEDYAAGAAPEYADQKRDQEMGRKIDVPVMVIYSKAMLGARIDVAAEWKVWIKDGTPYEPIGVGDNHGHYLPEEAHETVLHHIISFLDRYGVHDGRVLS